MSKFYSLTLVIIFTVIICFGIRTVNGAGDLKVSPILQENQTNQNNDNLPTGGLDGFNQPIKNESTDTKKKSISTGGLGYSNLKVNLAKQNPDIARPGEPIELTISVQNVGSNELKDINIKVEPKYPFSQISGEVIEKSISYLNANEDIDDASVIKFNLITDANASAGTYDLDLITTAKYESSSSNTFTTKKTIQLVVRGKEYAQVVTISKSRIDIATEEQLAFMITNTGNSPLKNMVISWEDPRGLIRPVYSDNTKYVKYLAPNQSVEVDYTIIADVNADPGLYTLNISINFEDYESHASRMNTMAGIFVGDLGGATDFDVSYSENSQGKTSLSVANIGNNKAYAVKVSIPEQKGYIVKGSSSTIVGNLQKGDYTTATFNITTTPTNGENSGTLHNITNTDNAVDNNVVSDSLNTHILKVQVEYTDSKGERLTVIKSVAVPASGFGTNSLSNTQSDKVGGISSILPFVIMIVIAGAGIYFYHKRKQGGRKPD